MENESFNRHRKAKNESFDRYRKKESKALLYVDFLSGEVILTVHQKKVLTRACVLRAS